LLLLLPDDKMQVRRLNMYKTRPVRDKKGRMIHEVRRGCGCGSCEQPPQPPLLPLLPQDHRTRSCAASSQSPLAAPHHQLHHIQARSPPTHPCRLAPSRNTHPTPRHATPQDLQSKDLPTTRIQPDRRWFGNTRVIGQQQLTQFREEMATKVGVRMVWLCV
jgi:hypothetical protein